MLNYAKLIELILETRDNNKIDSLIGRKTLDNKTHYPQQQPSLIEVAASVGAISIIKYLHYREKMPFQPETDLPGLFFWACSIQIDYQRREILTWIDENYGKVIKAHNATEHFRAARGEDIGNWTNQTCYGGLWPIHYAALANNFYVKTKWLEVAFTPITTGDFAGTNLIWLLALTKNVDKLLTLSSDTIDLDITPTAEQSFYKGITIAWSLAQSRNNDLVELLSLWSKKNKVNLNAAPGALNHPWRGVSVGWQLCLNDKFLLLVSLLAQNFLDLTVQPLADDHPNKKTNLIGYLLSEKKWIELNELLKSAPAIDLNTLTDTRADIKNTATVAVELAHHKKWPLFTSLLKQTKTIDLNARRNNNSRTLAWLLVLHGQYDLINVLLDCAINPINLLQASDDNHKEKTIISLWDIDTQSALLQTILTKHYFKATPAENNPVTIKQQQMVAWELAHHKKGRMLSFFADEDHVINLNYNNGDWVTIAWLLIYHNDVATFKKLLPYQTEMLNLGAPSSYAFRTSSDYNSIALVNLIAEKQHWDLIEQFSNQDNFTLFDYNTDFYGHTAANHLLNNGQELLFKQIVNKKQLALTSASSNYKTLLAELIGNQQFTVIDKLLDYSDYTDLDLSIQSRQRYYSSYVYCPASNALVSCKKWDLLERMADKIKGFDLFEPLKIESDQKKLDNTIAGAFLEHNQAPLLKKLYGKSSMTLMSRYPDDHTYRGRTPAWQVCYSNASSVITILDENVQMIDVNDRPCHKSDPYYGQTLVLLLVRKDNLIFLQQLIEKQVPFELGYQSLYAETEKSSVLYELVTKKQWSLIEKIVAYHVDIDVMEPLHENGATLLTLLEQSNQIDLLEKVLSSYLDFDNYEQTLPAIIAQIKKDEVRERMMLILINAYYALICSETKDYPHNQMPISKLTALFNHLFDQIKQIKKTQTVHQAAYTIKSRALAELASDNKLYEQIPINAFAALTDDLLHQHQEMSAQTVYRSLELKANIDSTQNISDKQHENQAYTNLLIARNALRFEQAKQENERLRQEIDNLKQDIQRLNSEKNCTSKLDTPEPNASCLTRRFSDTTVKTLFNQPVASSEVSEIDASIEIDPRLRGEALLRG